jgi:hypothetical protein
MIDDQNWPFEVSEKKRPLLTKILLFPIRFLSWIAFLVGFCFVAAMMGKAKREREFRKRYKKKIVDLGLFNINIWEERK